MNFFSLIRPILPLVFFATLGWVLHFSRGQYNSLALAAVVGTFILAQLGFQARADAVLENRSRVTLLSGILLLILILFLTLLESDPLVIYASELSDKQIMKVFILLAWILSVGMIFRLFSKRMNFPVAWLAIPVAISLIGAKVFAIWSSPHPFIDVFTLRTQAVDYFLAGKNPYPLAYVDIYKGFYHYPPAYNYWPGDLYFASLFKALTGDIRFASLCSDLGTAFCVHRILVKLKQKPLSWIFPLLWLAFPCSLFVLEQAWIDPLFLLFSAIFALFALDRRWLGAGIALGIFCAIKQYAIFFAILALFLSLRDASPKRSLKLMLAGALGAFGIVMVPFMLLDWDAFYSRTILLILNQEMRTDALTLTAWFHFLGLSSWTSGMSAAAYVLATVFGCFAVIRTRANPLHVFFCAVTLTYGVVFILGRQAFCNYYYLLAGFVLLQTVFGLGSVRTEPENHHAKH